MSEIELPSVEILRLQTGDIIVANFNGHPPHEAVSSVMDDLRLRFPDHECVAVGDGLRLSIVRESV